MRKIVYMLIGLCIGLTGCLNDETTGAHIEISDLKSSLTAKDTVLFTTTVDPVILDATEFVSQTDPNCPVEYTWSTGLIKKMADSDSFHEIDSLSVISHDSKLEYRFPVAGRHLLRLKVFNQYTAYVQYWLVTVSLGYDQGIVLFSNSEDGKGMFSILNSPKGIDTLLAMKPEQFSYVTGADDPILDEDIVDFIFYSGNKNYPDYGAQHMHILSRKNKAAYVVDQYSMQTIRGTAYKFSKTPLNLTMHWHSGNTRTQYDLFAFTEDGDVLSYCQKFMQEYPPMAFDTVDHWDRTTIGQSRMSADSKQFGDIRWLYNDETSTIYGMSHHDMQRNQYEFRRVNDVIGPYTFHGEEIINASYGLHYRYGMSAPTMNDVFIFTRSKENPKQIYMHTWFGVSFGSNFIDGYQYNNYKDLVLKDGEELAIGKDTRFFMLPETNQRFFHNGKKVFSMTGIAYPPLATKAAGREVFDLASINPNAEITDINVVIPLTGNKYYVLVATYDPTSAEEKKGSVYVLAADDLMNVVAKYENIAYKPLRIFYKYHDL